MDDRDPKVWVVMAKALNGKLFADKGCISPRLFDILFIDGIKLVTGIKTNMKNENMLRKRCIIETINDMLKNTSILACRENYINLHLLVESESDCHSFV